MELLRFFVKPPSHGFSRPVRACKHSGQSCVKWDIFHCHYYIDAYLCHVFGKVKCLEELKYWNWKKVFQFIGLPSWRPPSDAEVRKILLYCPLGIPTSTFSARAQHFKTIRKSSLFYSKIPHTLIEKGRLGTHFICYDLLKTSNFAVRRQYIPFLLPKCNIGTT